MCTESSNDRHTVKRTLASSSHNSNVASAFSQIFAESSPGFGLGMVINTVAKKFKDVESLSTNVVYKWMQANHQHCDPENALLILDCRPPEEYNVSHLPGAVRLDPGTSDMRTVQKLLQDCASNKGYPVDSEVNVVMYCAVGYRSSTMVNRYLESRQKKLIDKDYFKLYNLEGSLFKWGNEKRPMVDKHEQLTALVHPFSPMWGKLLCKEVRY